jgi:hypothetical protein
MRLPIILLIILLVATGFYLLFSNDEPVAPIKESTTTRFTPPPRPTRFRSEQARPPPAPTWKGSQTFIFPGEPGTRAPVTSNYRFRPQEGEERGAGNSGPTYAYPFDHAQITPYAPTAPATPQYRFRPEDSNRAGKRWTGNYR